MLNLIQHLAADPESSSGWRGSQHWWAVAAGCAGASHVEGGAARRSGSTVL